MLAAQITSEQLTLIDAIQQLESAKQDGGWLAVTGVGLALFIRAIRTDTGKGLMAAIHPSLQWDRLPLGWKRLLPFLIPAIGGALTAVAAGSGWAGIIIAAAAAGAATGASSFATHKATKKIGEVSMEAALRKDPNYKPGTLRKAMSLVVPLPKPKVTNDAPATPKEG